MKKVIELFVLMLLFCSISHARVVGNLTLGVPTVTITDAELLTAFADANTNQDCEFTNINIVSKNISYNPSTLSGFFIYVVSFKMPVSLEIYESQVSIPISYDAGDNEFEPIPNGGMAVCTKTNCVGCFLTDERTSCTSCAAIDVNMPYSCSFGTTDTGCGDWWMAILFFIVSWLTG